MMVPTVHIRWFSKWATINLPVLQQWHAKVLPGDYKGDRVADSPTGEPGEWREVPMVFATRPAKEGE